jgi:hypothetical protein
MTDAATARSVGIAFFRVSAEKRSRRFCQRRCFSVALAHDLFNVFSDERVAFMLDSLENVLGQEPINALIIRYAEQFCA